MQFLQQLIDVVFKKLNLFVFLYQQLSDIIRIIRQWTAATGCLTPNLFLWTLLLHASKSTKRLM